MGGQHPWVEKEFVGIELIFMFSKFGPLLQDFANNNHKGIRNRMGGES
jgi:hypothetical protein